MIGSTLSRTAAICTIDGLALQITTPYTLCSYMVRTYLGAASDGSTVAEERIGRLTGILVSTGEAQTS